MRPVQCAPSNAPPTAPTGRVTCETCCRIISDTPLRTDLAGVLEFVFDSVNALGAQPDAGDEHAAGYLTCVDDVLAIVTGAMARAEAQERVVRGMMAELRRLKDLRARVRPCAEPVERALLVEV